MPLRTISMQRDYRRRLTEIMGWIEANDPDQYNHCVVELNAEQANDPNLNYFGSTHDFVYERINFAFVIAFLSSEQNGKSYPQIRKHHAWSGSSLTGSGTYKGIQLLVGGYQ